MDDPTSSNNVTSSNNTPTDSNPPPLKPLSFFLGL